MINIEGLGQVIAQIQSERGISQDEIVEAIKDALVATAKRFHNNPDNLLAELSLIDGKAAIYALKIVVSKVEDPETEITKKDAKVIDENAKLGDEVKVEIMPPEFGRIAAQKAKQVIAQRIIEAEKKSIGEEFQDKIGGLIIGVVQRIEGRNYLINIGRTEAILDVRNQIPDEEFRVKDRVKLYLVDIAKTYRGPSVIISRSHEGFVQKMFEIEVPEIEQGIIEIKSISRRAGYRTKIAVHSNDPEVGAVGTCVGRMGSRIQAILKEINGEKIDIVEWKENIEEFISNALKPATVNRVTILDEEERKAQVVVDDDQLSLAIGRSGLNVRLASRLTNFSIDVVKKSEVEENLLDKMMASKEDHVEEVEETQVSEPEQEVVEEIKKIKVNEAARELGMDTPDFIAKLEELGHKVKSATSNIDYEVYLSVQESII